MSKNITIPTDEDGFVLLQCHICGEYFKLLASEVNDDSTINIWCPYCGLNRKQYAPNEVIDTSIKVAENELNEIKNSHKIGDTMTVVVNRNGQEKEITITLEETP